MPLCDICKQQFETYYKFTIHKREKHPEIRTYANPFGVPKKPPKPGPVRNYIDLSKFVDLHDPNSPR